MKNTGEQVNKIVGNNLQLIKFLFVGGVLFVIDFSTTLIAYYMLDFGPGLSSALGFITSFIVGFNLNNKFVFRINTKSRFSTTLQAALYLSLSLFNLVASSLIIEVLVNNGALIEIVKPVLVAIIAIWNYLIFKYFIFALKK